MKLSYKNFKISTMKSPQGFSLKMVQLLHRNCTITKRIQNRLISDPRNNLQPVILKKKKVHVSCTQQLSKFHTLLFCLCLHQPFQEFSLCLINQKQIMRIHHLKKGIWEQLAICFWTPNQWVRLNNIKSLKDLMEVNIKILNFSRWSH